MARALPDTARIVELVYASLFDPGAQAAIAAALCSRLRSHLVVLQLDGPTHRRNPVIAYDARGGNVPDLVDRMTGCEHPNAYMENGGQQKLVAAEVGHDAGLLPEGYLERTDFYQEVMRPFEIRHSMGICLSAHASGHVTALTVNRSRRAGYFDDADVAFVRTLYPHLRNVHALQFHLGEAESIARALDLADSALWLVDARHRAVYRNPQAERLLLDGRGGVTERGGRLRAAWRPDQHSLDHAFLAATDPGPHARRCLLLHQPDGQPCALAQVHPLPPSTFGGWLPSISAVAMLRVHPFAPARAKGDDALRTSFGLTAAETALAHALLRHGSLAECSRAFGKNRETLRTQLRALFAKTGTHRQPDLIRRLEAARGG